MRCPASLKCLWLAVVGTALLLPRVASALDPQQPPPSSGGSGWIVVELRPFAFGHGEANGRSSSLSQLHRLGWLECAGQPLAIEDFPELHDAIRDTWGTGPKGAFLVPDLRGFFLRGWQTARNEETYQELMGGDLIKGREDAPRARVRPDSAEVTYFIYVGRDVSRLDQTKGIRGN